MQTGRKMDKIKTKCKNCGHSVEQDGKHSLKRCGYCGVKYFFSINIDRSVHQYHCRPKLAEELKRRKCAVTHNRQELGKMKAKGYTPNQLQKKAYRMIILGLDS
jgi:DNA-directed RNA polymerase subunit RPC12/RpoP